jgi:hypothetical protein
MIRALSPFLPGPRHEAAAERHALLFKGFERQIFSVLDRAVKAKPLNKGCLSRTKHTPPSRVERDRAAGHIPPNEPLPHSNLCALHDRPLMFKGRPSRREGRTRRPSPVAAFISSVCVSGSDRSHPVGQWLPLLELETRPQGGNPYKTKAAKQIRNPLAPREQNTMMRVNGRRNITNIR